MPQKSIEQLTDEVSRGDFKAGPARSLGFRLQQPETAVSFGSLLTLRKPICRPIHPFACRLAFGVVAHAYARGLPASERYHRIERRVLAVETAAEAAGVDWAHELAETVHVQKDSLIESAHALEDLARPGIAANLELVPLTERLTNCLIFSADVKFGLLHTQTRLWPPEQRALVTERVQLGVELGMKSPPPPDVAVFSVPTEIYGFSESKRQDTFFVLTAETLPDKLAEALSN